VVELHDCFSANELITYEALGLCPEGKAGEFIDFSDDSLPVFSDEFEDDGSAVGAVFLAGVRFPVGKTVLVGGEWRWQNGSADLHPELNFAGDKLDLGGNTLVATVHFKF